MKDKKKKEGDIESDAFFEVDESVWEDDGCDGRKKRNSGKRRHRSESSDFGESGDAPRHNPRW